MFLDNEQANQGIKIRFRKRFSQYTHELESCRFHETFASTITFANNTRRNYVKKANGRWVPPLRFATNHSIRLMPDPVPRTGIKWMTFDVHIGDR